MYIHMPVYMYKGSGEGQEEEGEVVGSGERRGRRGRRQRGGW